MNFDKESKSDFLVGWEGGGAETKPVWQNVKRGKIQIRKHLHNVQQVVQSIFQIC